MRFRQPWLVRLLGFLGAVVLRGWIGTLRFQCRHLGTNVDPHRPDLPQRYIYAMWHEYLLLPISIYARADVHVLISHHGDGQVLAEICRHLGMPAVRGSTTRGGIRAVRELLEAGTRTHLSLSPDGPKGPRQRVQAGLIYLASRTGLPIVVVGFGVDRPRRLRSWDSFALPRPFSRARCITAEPIAIPAEADATTLEHYRQHVEAALTTVTDLAEHWADTGNWPADRAAGCGLGIAAPSIRGAVAESAPNLYRVAGEPS